MKKLIAMALALLVAVSCVPAVFADQVQSKGCLILGEDLTPEEKAKVLELLKVDDLSQYTVSHTSNLQEHEAFDDYLGADVVGSRALSSILLVPRKKGEGIQVSSYNITYCTVSMYQNALVSAGVKDVSISIAAPMPVSGTCALLSAMNAYAMLSGQELDEEAADTAAEELVTTGQVGESIGDKEMAAQLIAALKEKMVKEDLDEAQLSVAIDQACEKLGVTLDAKRKQQVIDLLLRIKNTDVDVDALAVQATELYHKAAGLAEKLDITPKKATGFLAQVFQWFADLLKAFS